MALVHAVPGAPIDVRPLGERLPATASHALLKTASIELMRIVLPAGRSLPPHRVPGEITILCIEGRTWLRSETGDRMVVAGDLVLLPGGDLHALEALDDSSFVVTVLIGQALVAAVPASAR